jgi:hypothetical protein
VMGRLLITSAMLATVMLAGAGCQKMKGSADLGTPYQAVVLTNGQVYFGKLDKLGAQFPSLTDVFYIHSQQNAETKRVTSTLVKRGREMHAPDRMLINAQHILFIEPVRPDSQLGKAIEDAKRAQASGQGGTGSTPMPSPPDSPGAVAPPLGPVTPPAERR